MMKVLFLMIGKLELKQELSKKNRSDTILAVCIVRNDEQWFGTPRGLSGLPPPWGFHHLTAASGQAIKRISMSSFVLKSC
jgi:hypothetical protein